jgi:hypothetical protein
MSSDIDDLLEQINTNKPDPVPVYVGSPIGTGWRYVPFGLAQKIAQITKAEEVQKPDET